MNPYQFGAWKTIGPPFRYFLRPTAEGVSNVKRSLCLARERKSGVVIVANHISALDPFFICCMIPLSALRRLDPITFLAKKQLFDRPYKRYVMERLGCVDVKRRSTLRRVVAQIRSGRTIFLFPEGRVSPDGSLGKDLGALNFFAKFVSFVVLPVRIGGIYGGFRKEWKSVVMRRRRFHVRFGTPLWIAKGSGPWDAVDIIRGVDEAPQSQRPWSKAA